MMRVESLIGQSMQKNIIVVGTPRSGTSLAASIFARKGYFVADNEQDALRDADHFNPGGYWEAEPLIEANVSLFQRVGYEHHNTWIFDAIEPRQALALGQLEPDPAHRELVAKYEENRPWVWKDPRLCYTLSYWWPLVDPETTAVLFVRRDIEETFRSFARIGWSDDDDAGRSATFTRMQDHLAAAEDAIAALDIPCVEVAYSDYRQAPDQVAALMTQVSGTTISVADLGFNDSYSSSTALGRLRVFTERALRALLPLPLRNGIRRLVPKSLMRKLFPGR